MYVLAFTIATFTAVYYYNESERRRAAYYAAKIDELRREQNQ